MISCWEWVCSCSVLRTWWGPWSNHHLEWLLLFFHKKVNWYLCLISVSKTKPSLNSVSLNYQLYLSSWFQDLQFSLAKSSVICKLKGIQIVVWDEACDWHWEDFLFMLLRDLLAGLGPEQSTSVLIWSRILRSNNENCHVTFINIMMIPYLSFLKITIMLKCYHLLICLAEAWP